MDTRLRYQNIIKSILQNHADYRASLPDGYTSQVVFDDERGQYLVLDMGWHGDRYLHATPIHLSLVGDKVWVQFDDTEEGVATDLMAAGVSKKRYSIRLSPSQNTAAYRFCSSLISEGYDCIITTPTHPTVKRLFDGCSRLSAAGDGQRYLAFERFLFCDLNLRWQC